MDFRFSGRHLGPPDTLVGVTSMAIERRMVASRVGASSSMPRLTFLRRAITEGGYEEEEEEEVSGFRLGVEWGDCCWGGVCGVCVSGLELGRLGV